MKKLRALPCRLGAALVCLLVITFRQVAAGEQAPQVYVILWFDTEDYLLPASDEAALRLARLLSRLGIRGVFKIVGERARVLERRQRRDVVAALQKHEIGYHSNWHSVPPTPAQYLADLGWDEGVAEFTRPEKPGFEDVRRIFGQTPTCYGQPGSSWAPQSYGALKQWGVQVYLDAGRHVSWQGKPCYYGGLLTLYHLTHTLRADLNHPEAFPQAQARFREARRQLLAEGGGIVSIFYHPCEFVHREFWDSVNFKYGANPPPELWRAPPQKSAAETERAFELFERYLRFLQSFPEVRFLTAREALECYHDRARGRTFTPAELKQIAQGVGEGITYQQHGDYALAASEIFWLLNNYVAAQAAGRPLAGLRLPDTPYGPTRPGPGLPPSRVLQGRQLLRTAQDVADYLRQLGRVPSTVWLGSVGVSPEVYLRALAQVVPGLVDGRALPAQVELPPAHLAAAEYVAPDRPELWNWVIFPRGFRAPALMELARRQAWTLKPALLHAQARPAPRTGTLPEPSRPATPATH
jgi:hypothetical protein